MQNPEPIQKIPGILVFIFVVTWVLIFFFAFMLGIKKSFRPPPKSDKQTAAELLREQRYKNDEILEQQRRLMEDRKTRMRDMQRTRR